MILSRCGNLVFKYLRLSSQRNTFVQKYKIAQNAYGIHSGPVKYGTENVNNIKPSILPLFETNVNDHSGVKLSFLLKELENFDLITEKQVTLLLKQCNRILPDNSGTKADVLDTLWTSLKKYNCQLSLAHYNLYIHTCTKNGVKLFCDLFISQMTCAPDQSTYRLLLENVCEHGDLDQAFAILNQMKQKNFAVDETVFNCFVLAHTIQGGLSDGEKVFATMRAAQILDTNASKMALLRGLIKRSDDGDFELACQNYSFRPNEEQFITFLQDLGLSGNYSWLSQNMKLFGIEQLLGELTTDIENVCVHLVHLGKAKAAVYIYKALVRPAPEVPYAKILMKEMINSDSNIELIIKLATELKDSKLNMFVFEDAVESALQTMKFDMAWRLLENLQNLRPHFFWPLLINAGKKDGEDGVVEVLEKMLRMGIKADTDTLLYYCIPFCELLDITLLVQRLQKTGYTVKELLSPILAILLSRNKIFEAKTLCSTYKVNLNGSILMKPLATSWKCSGDVKATVFILQKLCESESGKEDWSGLFLSKLVKLCETVQDIEKFHATLKQVAKEKLRITPSSADILTNLIRKRYHNTKVSKDILETIDSLLDFSIMENQSAIPHPRDMTLEQLECHLLELEQKNMETRGVLRRLIQKHSGIGNPERVEELRQKLTNLGYIESPGMKASMMHSYVQSGKLVPALDLFYELKSLHKKFKIDTFKILDLATLMVTENQFDEAVKILKGEAEYRILKGEVQVERNCWQLLNTSRNPQQAEQLFRLLINCGYCKPTNVILGPLVRVHLKCNDLENATKAYLQCTQEFGRTPLQLELLCALLEAREQELFQKALDATEKVHSKTVAVSSLIYAFAEQNMEKSLETFLKWETSMPSKEMFRKRYDRWVSEDKLTALLTVHKACEKLTFDRLDLRYIELCIMKLYRKRNDCDGAVAFWEELVGGEGYISPETRDVLFRLLDKCKYEIPSSLQARILNK